MMSAAFLALLKKKGPTIASPLDIPGCILWLDGDDLATITQSGGAISAWADKSSGARSFAQANAINKPATNTSRFTARNCIDFGASNQKYLTTSSNLSIPTTSTCFFVVYWDSRVSNSAMALQKGNAPNAISGSAGVPYYGVLSGGAAGEGWLQEESTGSIWAATHSLTIIPLNSRSQVTFTMPADISTALLRVNGASQTTDVSVSHTTAGSMAVNTIGSSDSTYKTNGAVAEAIVYNTVLSASDIALVEAYLKAKWGTP